MVRLEGLSKLKHFNDLIAIRIRDLPACEMMPQQTVLPSAQYAVEVGRNVHSES
jgi:hypothetical protein